MNDYIGISNGYLGDFDRRTLSEFYPIYCENEINLGGFSGDTNRYLFQDVITKSNSTTQAKIIKGVFEKYPIESFDESSQPLKKKIAEDYLAIIERLESEAESLSEQELEAHFEKIQNQIIDEIDKAKYLIWIAVAWFTDKKIFSRLAHRKHEGLTVELILLNNTININSGLDYDKYITTFRAVSHEIKQMMHVEILCTLPQKSVLRGHGIRQGLASEKNLENITIGRHTETVHGFATELVQN